MHLFNVKARYRGVRSVSLAAAILAGSAALSAQTIVGTWQGTLATEQQQRIMLKVAKADDGSLRATCYRLGTGGSGLPMTSVKFAAPVFEAEQSYAGMSYKGKLSEDGKSLEGTWTLGKLSFPLTLVLATAETMWTLDYGGVAAMAADVDPSFEVATVKLTPPDQKMARYGTRTRSFKAVNQTAVQLICWAYHLQPGQIEGAPAWASDVHYDVVGKPGQPGQPSEEQYQRMMRKLLAERFNLKTHAIEKVVPVYALTVEKLTPAVTKSDSTADPHGNIIATQTGDGQLQAQVVFFTMGNLADWLMNFIHDRQIVDETGMKGQFDFTLKVPMDVITGSSNVEDRAVAFFQAVRPLGLKLMPKKEPIEVLVIERLEKPTAN